ncbi:hypothetical protein [Castellaniella sp. GW247-6E4]|uniref:hypothetical protein n=1 Tax=Castellaniella sp. GW247-6E4 TaxID=3140380 RepID=UPI003315B0C4
MATVSLSSRLGATIRLALIAGSGMALGACANIAATPPGTPIDQVQAQFGAPTLTCTSRAGKPRAIWSQQPYGQFAWGSDLTSDGRVERIEPVLTDAHFKVLAEGTWTPEQVRCEFGPPAQIDTAGLPSVRQIVWNYRYRQDGVWNSLMFVFFGRDGAQVTKFHPGPDPMYLQDDRSPRF